MRVFEDRNGDFKDKRRDLDWKRFEDKKENTCFEDNKVIRERKKEKEKKREEEERFKIDEVSGDSSNESLEPSWVNFEDGGLVPMRFDPCQTGNQSIRQDIVTFLCAFLNQGYGLLPIPDDRRY